MVVQRLLLVSCRRRCGRCSWHHHEVSPTGVGPCRKHDFRLAGGSAGGTGRSGGAHRLLPSAALAAAHALAGGQRGLCGRYTAIEGECLSCLLGLLLFFS